MGSHEYIQNLLPMYALGGLSKVEREEVKQHLAECSECRKLLGVEIAIVQMIPRSVEKVEPSRETKTKLFARVDADLARTAAPVRRPQSVRSAPAPRRSWFAQPVFAFAVFAILALLAVGGWLVLRNQPSPEQVAINEIISHPNVQKIALAGTKDAPNAQAVVYLVPGRSDAVLVVNGLQPLPQDKGYEFWFFRGSDPQASNVFTVNPDGTTTVLLNANDKVENFKGWGVTIEPRQGVPKPTGTLVVSGGL